MVQVVLLSGGVPWQGWESVNISSAIDGVFNTFDITTTDRFQQGLDRWNVRGGSDVELFVDEELVFTGICKRYNPSIDSPATHRIAVSGKSLTNDIVTGSHDGSYFWKKDTRPEDIISEVLQPYQADYEILKPMTPIGEDGFRVAVNSSAFSIVKKLAEKDALLVHTNRTGKVILSDGSENRDLNILTRGDYIHLSVDHDLSNVYSEIIVKHEEKNIVGKSFAEKRHKEVRIDNSEAQPRHHPLILIYTGSETEANKFSKYVQHRYTGASINGVIKVKSPRNKQGQIWETGQRVWLEEPLVDVNQELIVSSVDMSISASDGFTCTLGLTIPEALSIDTVNTLATRRAIRRSSGIFSSVARTLGINQ